MNKENSLKLIAEIETRTIKAIGKSLDAMSERVLAYSKPDYEPYFDGYEMGTTLVKNMVSKTQVEEGSEPLPKEVVKAIVVSDKGLQICKKVVGKIREELEGQIETLKEELSKEGRSDSYVEVYLSGYSMVTTLITVFEGCMLEIPKAREKELG